MFNKLEFLIKKNIYYLYIFSDFIIFWFICNKFIFNDYSLNFKNLFISNTVFILWSVINYILGSNINRVNKLFNIFFKLLFNYTFALLIYLPMIIISLWNYPLDLNVDLFLNFVRLNYLSFIIHLANSTLFSLTKNKKSR